MIRFSSLGDIILTTPLLKILRQYYPDAEIDYCTKQQYAELLKFNPHINNVIEIENNFDFIRLYALRKQIKANHYDLIIDLHNNLRTFYLRLFSDPKKLVFRKYWFRKFLLVKFKINLMKSLPSIKERYCNTLSPLLPAKPQAGVSRYEMSGRGVLSEIYTDKLTEQKVNKLFTDLQIPASGIICIAPSSKHFTKTYPPELYIKLINSFNSDKYSFLLLGKGNDRNNIELIKTAANSINIYNLCDRFNLAELTEVIKRCSLFISGDTGPMHIAEAFNKPIIMLAGSSVREFGFYPQSGEAKVLEVDGLSCRPCSHIGRSSCPKEHFKCMKDITPENILTEIKRIL